MDTHNRLWSGYTKKFLPALRHHNQAEAQLMAVENRRFLRRAVRLHV